VNLFAVAFNLRYALITWPAILIVVGVILMLIFPGQVWWILPLTLLCGWSVLQGIHDLRQTRHAVLRNYPVAAHLRFLLESIRPEMRQYFFEGDKDGTPFPRDKRAIVYQRAKKDLDKRPFGTQYDVYQEHYEWLHHSIAPQPAQVPEAMRISPIPHRF
jgi:glutamate synthase domain-containing protein 2